MADTFIARLEGRQADIKTVINAIAAARTIAIQVTSRVTGTENQ